MTLQGLSQSVMALCWLFWHQRPSTINSRASTWLPKSHLCNYFRMNSQDEIGLSAIKTTEMHWQLRKMVENNSIDHVVRSLRSACLIHGHQCINLVTLLHSEWSQPPLRNPHLDILMAKKKFYSAEKWKNFQFTCTSIKLLLCMCNLMDIINIHSLGLPIILKSSLTGARDFYPNPVYLTE